MVGVRLTLSISLVAVMSVSTCAKKEDAKKDKPKADEPVPVGALALPNDPAAVFGFVDKGVTSSPTLPETKAMVAPGTLATGFAVRGIRGDKEEDSFCDSNGNPKNQTTGQPIIGPGVQSDPDIGTAGVFFCLIHQKSEDPTTVQGAYSMAKGLAEMIGTEFVGDGNEHAKTVTQTITEEGVSQDFLNTVTYKAVKSAPMGKTGAWDYLLDTKMEMAPVAGGPVVMSAAFKMLVKTTADLVAFHVIERCGSCKADQYADSYAVSLNLKAGELRFEHRTHRAPDAMNERPEPPMHTRLLVKGTMDATGAFTAVSSMEGVKSQTEWTPSEGTEYGDPALNWGSGLMTIKGTKDAGFVTNRYYCDKSQKDCSNTAIAQYPAATPYCTAGTCAGLVPIKFESAEDLKFILDWRTASAQPAAAMPSPWFEAAGPLDFAIVTTARDQ